MHRRGIARIAGLLVMFVVLALGCARAAEDGLAPEDGVSEDAAAILEAVSGTVEVQRDGEWLTGEEGAELALDDQVRTDADSFARLRFLDDDPDSGADATLIDLSSDTTVSLEELAIEQDEEGTHRTGLLGVLRGAINAITKGWGSGSLFSVRAGTTVCGVRGSVANVGYDPEEEEATVTALDGEMYTFEARTRQEALQRTRSAMRELRAGRRTQFLSRLEVGRQVMRNRRGRVQRRRVDMRQMMEARRAALDSRRGGLAAVRGRINAIAKVKAPRRRPGRLARKRIEKRIQNRQDSRDRRRPSGVRKRVQDRLQGGSMRDRLQRKPPERRPAPAPDIRPGLGDRLKQPGPVRNKLRQNRQGRQRQRRIERKKRQLRRKVPRLR